MKQHSSEARLIWLGLLLFLGLSIYLIATSGKGGEFYPPLSTLSPRPNGAMALYELLEASGQPVERHLQSAYNYPPRGAVAVLDQSMPDAATLFTGGLDAKALTLWMQRGGSLVLVASSYSFTLRELLDEIDRQAQSPLHSGSYGLHREEALDALAEAGHAAAYAPHDRSGLSGETSRRYNMMSRTAENGEIYKLSAGAPPLFSGVAEIEMAPPGYSSVEPGAVLFEVDDPPQPVLFWLPVGEGELLWLAAPEVATNGWIQRADNHRLLLNLLTAAARGRTLHFDEHRHGYREQGPDALGLIFQTTGGQLLLMLLLLAALAFAGSAVSPARFMPPPVPPRRQSTEMVLAQASLYQRAGLRRPIAMHLLDGLRQAVRRHERWGAAPDDGRLAEWLHQAGARGLPVDPLLLQVMDGRTALGTERQLWHFARACDRLRAAL